MAPMAQYGTAGDKKQPENKKTDPASGGDFQRKCAVEVIGPDRLGAL